MAESDLGKEKRMKIDFSYLSIVFYRQMVGCAWIVCMFL